MLCGRISCLCLVSFLALWSPGLQVQAQLNFDSLNITRAVELLAERFQSIANDGLGISALKENYNSADFSFSQLEESEINQLLSNFTFANTINEVLNLFESIESGPGSANVLSPTDCCLANPSDACCYECASSNLETIAATFRDTSLVANRTLLLGSADGSLLVQPPDTPSANCDKLGMDARLQTWFTSTTRVNPLEVVIVLDLFQNRFIGNEDFYKDLRFAVSVILNSLTNRDRVALVGVNSSPQIPRATIFSTTTETIPVCAEAIIELESFITSFSPISANYDEAFSTAFNLFSDSNATDKALVFFTPGVAFGGNANVINSAKEARNATISVIRVIDDLTSALGNIADSEIILSLDGTSLAGPISSLVGGYYTPPSSSLVTSTRVTYGHSINRAGGSLSITRPYFDSSNGISVRVLRALLPWHQLLNHIYSALSNRPSSYIFVTDSSGRVLYHPLVPSNGRDDVLITEVETEGVIMNLLGQLSTTNLMVSGAVAKSLLKHTGSRDDNAFLPRDSPSTYYCRLIRLTNEDTLNLCVVLADVDVTMATLNQVNPADVYVDGRAAPIYHNLRLSADLANTCNYFCKRSLNNQVSFQLTGPGVPPDSPSFVSEITSYISGQSSSSPSGVEPLIATEIALSSSAVASRWTNTSSDPSQYITRRHLVTSSGVYLTFPAVHFDRNFAPSRTEWYQAATARGNLLTLTPPRTDSLREGGEFAISAAYTIRAPSMQGVDPSNSNGTRPLVVVAADLTVSSLRWFLREAVPGCEEDSSTSCFIIDDQGNLVYDRDLFSNSEFDGVPQFLGQPLGEAENLEFRGVFFDLIRGPASQSNLLTKEQCVDFYSPDIETRRFYRLDTSNNNLVMNVSDRLFCIDYMLQHIPGTNSFLVALKRKSNCEGDIICTCSLVTECTNCDVFNSRFCECPCVCSDDCQPNPGREVQACPPIVIQDANLNVNPLSALTNSNLDPQFCFNQECNCRSSLDSCLSSRECNWCEQENKCVHISDCCTRDEGGACCRRSPQEQRFSGYGTCGSSLQSICQNQPGAFDATCPSFDSNQTSIIVPVVVGCIFAVFLIVILIVFIIWYQFFRRSDVTEETSRESAFDFSKKRMDSTNPMTAVAVKDPNTNTSDIKSDTGSEVGQATTQSNSHPPEKVNGKEKEKDETNL